MAYSYTVRGRTYSSPRKLRTQGELAALVKAAKPVRKAAAKPMIPVYNSAGVLIGLIDDPSKITPIKEADSALGSQTAPASPPAVAPAAPATGDAAMVAKAIRELNAALSTARFVTGPAPLVKSAGGQANYSALLKTLDAESQAPVKSATTAFAMAMVSKGKNPAAAIDIAQATAARVAFELPRSAVQKRTQVQPVRWAGGGR